MHTDKYELDAKHSKPLSKIVSDKNYLNRIQIHFDSGWERIVSQGSD